MAHLLLIDDDPALLSEQIRHAFQAPQHRLDVVTSGADGIDSVRRDRPEVVLLDLRLPDLPGLQVFEEIRRIDPALPVIFITIAKAADAAIEAMKHGAFDYLHKPLDVAQLRHVVGEATAVARLRAPVAVAEVPAEATLDSAMLGGCSAMLDVYKGIGRVAAQDVTVLITGESGTGKELVARAICQHGRRANAPFVALNCAAIPEALLESELFGHEKGAFTGADRRRIGRFEQCNGGTLLLDEIGDMPISLQAKILRVLQEQRFERVGGNETIATDVRVIASTHRDLEARSAAGTFRPDLYYRLGVFKIHLPPLRERGEDIGFLARHFTRRFSRDFGRDVVDLAPDAVARLRAYSWPGNVRELQSVLKQALLRASGSVLLSSFLPELAPSAEAPAAPPAGFDLAAFIGARLTGAANDLYDQAHGEVDRLLFARTLEFTNGNHREAARLLGISRQTMRTKMRALGLYVARSVERDDGDAQD